MTCIGFMRTRWPGCKGLKSIIDDPLGQLKIALQVDDDNLLFPSFLPKGVTDNYAAVVCFKYILDLEVH